MLYTIKWVDGSGCTFSRTFSNEIEFCSFFSNLQFTEKTWTITFEMKHS